MGELVVSARPEAELVALGLGSCIGLAVVDPAARVAGLAHIVLPHSRQANDQGAKFANLAVPRLLARVRRHGGMLHRLQAALVGGAQMFELTDSLDIGARNEQAVRDALRDANLTVTAALTGGRLGRTVRVHVGTGTVTVRCARSAPVTLLGDDPGTDRSTRDARPMATTRGR